MEGTKTYQLNEVVELAEKLFALKEKHASIKKDAAEVWAEYEKAEATVLTILEDSGLDMLKTSRGVVSYKYAESFRVPKTAEDKQLFFEYLKQKGVFNEMISVNSNTINSFAKIEMENAEQRGELDFNIPGLEKSAPIKKVVMRKA